MPYSTTEVAQINHDAVRRMEHDAARAYAESRIELHRKALQGDREAQAQLLDDILRYPRTVGRLTGLDRL